MDTLLLDLRYAIRALKRSPGFTALAILTLGLGIGAATAGFGLLNRIFLRPVPGVRDPSNVGFTMFSERGAHGDMAVGITDADRAHLIQATPTVIELAGWQGPMRLGIAAPGAIPALAEGAFVTGDYLHLLGVIPAMGRLIDSSDDLRPAGLRVAVISDRLWRDLYGGRQDILGSPLLVNGVQFSVAGVTPPGFRGPDRLELTDFWIPGNTYWDVQHFDSKQRPREIDYYRNIVRIRPHSSFDLATSQLLGAVRALATDTSRFDSTLTARVVPGAGIERAKDSLRHQLFLILGVSGLVLLVACANVANLLLFRRAQRRADVVVRLSLGAGTGRLVRLLLAESGLIGAIGSLVGVGLAALLIASFGKVRMPWRADLGAIPFDVRVVAFAAGSGILASLLAGVIPALVATRVNLGSDLKASGPNQAGGAPRLRLSLAVLQVSVSLALVAGAYLFADTIRNYAQLPLGFNPVGVSVFHVDPKRMGYDSPRQRAYYQVLMEKASAIPGVTHVGLVDVPPFAGMFSFSDIVAAGAPDGTKPLEATEYKVSGTYFTTLGIRLERGRIFTQSELWPDTLNRVRPLIVSVSLARKLFGDRDPVGALVDLPAGRTAERGIIVGVVADTRIDLTGPIEPAFYQPVGQGRFDYYSPAVLVQSSLPERMLSKEFQSAARTVDGSLPVDSRGTLVDAETASIASKELLFRVVGILSGLTLVLTIVGVYGIVAYGVTTRTREFGIRTALGAVPANLVRVALRPALIITAVGTLAGVAGSLYLTKFIAASLYGVSRFDPFAFVTAALILAAAVLLASWLPARRAAKIDPMVALRYE
ncbi:MAG TPA: ADOP family duplicated permease [Gemmatimonadales bacterium]|jgi:predicted permease|nr:ADOP family duplicated permease [Gemmatimonadales bacterium]